LTKDACPKNLPYRCENGACAEKVDNCRTENGCPHHTSAKCAKNGLCAKDD